MASSNNSASSGGIGVAGLLGVAFVVLKLTHVVAWSWWWVLAPFWIPGTLVVLLVLVTLAFAVARAVRRG